MKTLNVTLTQPQVVAVAQSIRVAVTSDWLTPAEQYQAEAILDLLDIAIFGNRKPSADTVANSLRRE